MLFGRTIVVAKYLLIEVTEKMERFNADIGSLESPLYEAPEILQPVRVNLPTKRPLSRAFHAEQLEINGSLIPICE